MVCTYSDFTGFFKCLAIGFGGSILALTIMGIGVLFLISISNKNQ